MRVIFQSRRTLFSVPGGDTIQIIQTAAELRALGCLVDICTDLETDLSAYDVVHLFNLTRPQELLMQIRHARERGKKIVLSTIYVDFLEYERLARKGMGRFAARLLPHSTIEYSKTIARAIKNGEMHRGVMHYLACGHPSAQREIIRSTDLFMPNSEHEMQRVIADFPDAAGKPYLVVPNAVDESLFGSLSAIDTVHRDSILCVARIEGRKNQLHLVRAMRDLPWKLMLIGQPAPNHGRYYNEIRKIAGANVHIRGEVPHEQLPAYYGAARVHVLASWMETTGLSSLEAGAMGCNLVITDKGDTREYFGDSAFYCDPSSVQSIRDAIVKAFNSPVEPELRNRILRDYVWRRAAEKTLEGYELILSLSD
ncbi:MAG: glycosyltransferase family 4 protein [Desulfuromonadales bacterium]